MMNRILELVGAKRPPALVEREGLVQKLAELMPSAVRRGEHLGLLLIDVRSSDAHLQSLHGVLPNHVRLARQRLQAILRPGDVLAKIGWERFAVLLHPLKGEGHALLAGNKIMQALMSVVDEETTAHPDVAIGAVVHPEHGRNPEHLLRLAELACERARGEEGRISLYSRLTGSGPADELARLREFKLAIQNNDIEVWLQPQIRASDGTCVGAEALMRWQRKPGEFVPPPEMVTLAERNGLTALLTSRILKSALCAWAELKAEGVNITISVNLCAQDVTDPELPELVRQGLSTWCMPPDRLVLEVTEGSLIGDVKMAMQVLDALTNIGCRISIDDFGTGYSSMAYLTRLPLDELKIDQVFVRDMLADPNAGTIVRAIADLANNLGLQAVAEGVGDRETAGSLAKLGCAFLQGYLMSRPLPLAEFKDWLRNWDPQAFIRRLADPDA